MRKLIIVSVLLLGACATAKETYTPDGSKGFSIACSGSAMSWGECYEKAGEVCGPRGYKVIAGGADKGAVIAGGSYGLFGSTTQTRNMLISCN